MKTKTYLARLGILTQGMMDNRKNFDWALVEANSPADAETLALQFHCFEAFESGADQNGNWTEVRGHRAFQLSEDRCDVDAECVFWIESVSELPEADAIIMQKYLPKFKRATT